MTDIQAAIGRIQLQRLPEIIKKRRFLAHRYHEMLADMPGLKLPEEPSWAKTNWQSYCVHLPDDCDQRQVMQTMLDSGIATRRAIMCAHREDAYKNGLWRCLQCEREGKKETIHAVIISCALQTKPDSDTTI